MLDQKSVEITTEDSIESPETGMPLSGWGMTSGF